MGQATGEVEENDRFEAIESDYLTNAVKDLALERSVKYDWEKSFIQSTTQSGSLPSISLIHFRFKKLSTGDEGPSWKPNESVKPERKLSLGLTVKGVTVPFKHPVDQQVAAILNYSKILPSIDGLGKYLGIKIWANLCNVDPDDLRHSLPKEISCYRIDDGSFKESHRRVDVKAVLINKDIKLKKGCINIISPKDALYWRYRLTVSPEDDFGLVRYDKVIKPNSDIPRESTSRKIRRKFKVNFEKAIQDENQYKFDQKALINPVVWCLPLTEALIRMRAIKEGRLVNKSDPKSPKTSK